MDFNIVVMFPYPSGAGLHLGHYYNYAIVDSYCRWLRYKGHEVHQPFGYDAFGLPAENYARSIGGDPREVTTKNIESFRIQMKRMDTQFEEKLVTCDPSYIKWTQWIFTRLYEKGLAYKADGAVNWCNSCNTVLANEQVKDNHCDRCDTVIVQKTMNQWYFKITDYKERLFNNLENIDYPVSTKKQQALWLKDQRDWCVSRQRKWGCPIPIEGETDTLDTFVDSSFYYLRYLTDSHTEFLPKGQYRPVDLYVGGSEHACMHLIYARFIHHFLYDIGIVPQEEPFNRVIHQGMITSNGMKMGKSKGNAINPDNYDPDELRMYLMFLGHYFDGGDWADDKIIGLKRFFNRVKSWLSKVSDAKVDLTKFESKLHYNVTNFKFNKVVSDFMEFYNNNKKVSLDQESRTKFIAMLRCFAPGFKEDIR
jgi:leucyl-tRNA synthetase